MWNGVGSGIEERPLHATHTDMYIDTGCVMHNADSRFLFARSPFNSIILREFCFGKWTFDSLIRATHTHSGMHSHMFKDIHCRVRVYVSRYKMCCNSLIRTYTYICRCVCALEGLTAFGLSLIPKFVRSNSFVLNFVATTVVAVSFAGISFGYLLLVIARQQSFGGSLKPLLSSILWHFVHREW